VHIVVKADRFVFASGQMETRLSSKMRNLH